MHPRQCDEDARDKILQRFKTGHAGGASVLKKGIHADRASGSITSQAPAANARAAYPSLSGTTIVTKGAAPKRTNRAPASTLRPSAPSGGVHGANTTATPRDASLSVAV